ncbi:MAG: hypothetical protein QXS37_06700, partial [Candidatus Aenigmatarchaeota archaeon]
MKTKYVAVLFSPEGAWEVGPSGLSIETVIKKVKKSKLLRLFPIVTVVEVDYIVDKLVSEHAKICYALDVQYIDGVGVIKKEDLEGK